MATVVQLNLDNSFETVNVVSNAEASKIVADSKDFVAAKNKLLALISALEKAREQTDSYGKLLFANHSRQIVHLAIQIAHRYLAHRVEQKEYEIETILAQAIEQIPAGQPVEIRINPEDLKTYEQSVQNGGQALSGDFKLTADWSVGPAECIIQTPQGIMEHVVEEYLKQTEAALQAAQKK